MESTDLHTVLTHEKNTAAPRHTHTFYHAYTNTHTFYHDYTNTQVHTQTQKCTHTTHVLSAKAQHVCLSIKHTCIPYKNITRFNQNL